jgi:purine-nucleoside phosphorylase
MLEYEKILEARDTIRAFSRMRPAIGLILGSGLSSVCRELEHQISASFADIPHFPNPVISDHAGRLVMGDLLGIPVAALSGRPHLYEGFSMAQIGFPVRVLGCLGIRKLIVTNAAGAVNEDFAPGDMMLIRDHINFMGANPLAGANLDEMGPRFPDMSEAYDPILREAALQAAASVNLEMKTGVYIAFAGPSYETPAEIRMCRSFGADAVGMSTVPEVIVANHMGMRVLGLSCLTNPAAGIRPLRLSHREVLEAAEKTKGKLLLLLKALLPRIEGIPDPGEAAP